LAEQLIVWEISSAAALLVDFNNLKKETICAMKQLISELYDQRFSSILLPKQDVI
jgi:hypothetical protein